MSERWREWEGWWKNAGVEKNIHTSTWISKTAYTICEYSWYYYEARSVNACRTVFTNAHTSFVSLSSSVKMGNVGMIGVLVITKFFISIHSVSREI